jgi:hypothetical protein
MARAARLVPFALLALAVAPAARGFTNVAVGEIIRNRDLPALGGGTQPLLARARTNVFVFFRPNQDHSLQTLSELARLEVELAGKPVRFVAITSDSYEIADVREAVRASGIRMPVLLDRGDALYGELGVRLHPVVGIADGSGRLAAYQHFLRINMLDVVRGRIQFLLGEIDERQMARLVAPEASPTGQGKGAARSRLALARALLARNDVKGAAENARAAIAVDPGLAAAHALLADALAAGGSCSEAERERAQAAALDPGAVAAQARVACTER